MSVDEQDIANARREIMEWQSWQKRQRQREPFDFGGGMIIEGSQREPLLQVAGAVKENNPARKNNNWVYVAWFLFYFIFFSVITLGIAIPFFIIPE